MSRGDRKSSRKDNYAWICILSYISSFIFRIVLVYLIGERGIAYFSFANEIYILTGCLLTYGFSRAVYTLVRFRTKREQYKSAGRVFRTALLAAFLTGLLAGLLILTVGPAFLRNVVDMPLSILALSIMAFAVPFQLLSGVCMGYFEGNGSKVPSAHSMVVKALLTLLCGIAGASMFHKYGLKVSALLRNEDYAASYGAFGSAAGILAVSVLGFFHLLLLLLLYRSNVKKQAARDLQKNQEKGFWILRMLFVTALPFSGYAILFRILPFLDGVLFIRSAEEGADTALLWGSYYGKYLPVIGIVCFLVILLCRGQVKRIIYYIDREETRIAGDFLSIQIHKTALVSVPAAIFTAVLSGNIMNLLFKGNNENNALLLSAGSAAIVLLAFTWLFSDILIRLGRMNYVIACEGAALLLHTVILKLLLGSMKFSAMPVVISNLLFFAVTAAATAFLTSRHLRYRMEWLRTLAFVIIDGAVAGILVMLLNRLFISLMGETAALIICLPAGIVAYMVLLVVTRAVSENELEDMDGGKILLMLGRQMRLM